MQVIHETGNRPIKAWVGMKTVDAEFGPRQAFIMPDIEDTAMKQLRNMATLSFIAPNGIAVMPDVHAGIGATVGSVIATRGAVIPAAAGVDLGCGMNAVRTTLTARDLPDSLAAVRAAIEAAVPVGAGKSGNHRDPDTVDDMHLRIMKRVGVAPHGVRALGIARGPEEHAAPQLGTLGGGNHFIELCVDEADEVWVMLHSGSRGIGNIIGRAYIEKARRKMERYFIQLPDRDLAYLPEGSRDFGDYMAAVAWAQDYALENRRVMLDAVLGALHKTLPIDFSLRDEAVECHHNYIARENHFDENLWVTRKGAILARDGVLGIIPGSMGQRSYIVRGKGNPESYCSCSHGAGRVMSRTAARARFTVADLEEQTRGVECRKDVAVIDEIPSSYKDIDQVMANQRDLVDVVHVLKAVLCVKGA